MQPLLLHIQKIVFKIILIPIIALLIVIGITAIFLAWTCNILANWFAETLRTACDTYNEAVKQRDP